MKGVVMAGVEVDLAQMEDVVVEVNLTQVGDVVVEVEGGVEGVVVEVVMMVEAVFEVVIVGWCVHPLGKIASSRLLCHPDIVCHTLLPPTHRRILATPTSFSDNYRLMSSASSVCLRII